MNKALTPFFITLFLISCNAQKTERIAFYNVENLFDTINGPNNDEEFLPKGKKEWNSERYNTKIDHINQIICGLKTPMLMGLCEIENKDVIEDIIHNNKKLKHYKPIHFNSLDARGIDVGLIYNTKKLTLLDKGLIRFNLPEQDTPTSRDILWAKLSYKNEVFYTMVNHWPSRRGGTEKSAPKRIKAATKAKEFIDSLLSIDINTKVILMGDLNDYPSNRSVTKLQEIMTSCITKESNQYGGTNSYRGQWNILDHIMISNGFQNMKLRIKPESGKIYSPDYLITEYKGNKVPFRTYGGSKYLEGYSDHLPVYIELSLKK
ncbi:endonuclease/exonuclease/phosphatase family protein [Crocinitomicaceae bacterium]|jgi:predicted extracellular nuclease|nr:endonuclease/exonuclease/phosphatase family protein [Crocinitomicaceae bacterium]MDB4649903.1 endonuclease/exonuclease/phosphatase family protein [Crocinitomicaceae bacterium]